MSAPEALLAVMPAASHALWLVPLLHVAAALKHQFIDRDHLLRRMMPGRR